MATNLDPKSVEHVLDLDPDDISAFATCIDDAFLHGRAVGTIIGLISGVMVLKAGIMLKDEVLLPIIKSVKKFF